MPIAMSVRCLITNWLSLKYGLFQVRRGHANINQGMQSPRLVMADGWDTAADSRMTQLEGNTFMNTSIFLRLIFHRASLTCSTVRVQLLKRRLCCTVSQQVLCSCQCASSTSQIFSQFFFPHAPLTTYFTSGDAHLYNWAWNGASDMPVHILDTLNCNTVQQISPVQWPFGQPIYHCTALHWALGKMTVHLCLQYLTVSIAYSSHICR